MIAASSGKGRYGNIAEVLRHIKHVRGRVLLKPNLVAPGSGATHVDAVRAVLDSLDVELIAEGSSVDTAGLFRSLGYEDLARDYGIELVDVNEHYEWDEISFLGVDGGLLRARVSKLARRYKVVSLSMPKTHDHAIVTLSIKNVVGFLHPRDRSMVHGYSSVLSRLMGLKPLRTLAAQMTRISALRRYFSVTDVGEEKYVQGARVIHRNIAALARYADPCLGILDGYVGMQGRGPVAGETLEWDMALAGPPIECDAYCASRMGFDPRDVGYLHYLQAPSLEDIDVVGSIPGKAFKPHPKIRLQMMWRSPYSWQGEANK